MLYNYAWFEQDVHAQEQDVALNFEGELPMRGLTADFVEYEIAHDPLRGDWTVWLTKAIDEYYETCEKAFHGTKNACLNWVHDNLEVS